MDPTLLIPGIVQREFRRVVVREGVAEVSPAPRTLVNIDTIFTTPTDDAYEINLNVPFPGQSVVITARPVRWTWYFGDGEFASTSAQQTRGKVTHVYRQAASREAYVVIDWAGTFRINGGEEQQVTGTATTTGDPVPVDVRQARSELVRD